MTMTQQLRAGTAQVDITPALGLELAGYPHAPRNNTGVLDPLYATCVFVDDGEIQLAMIGMDTLFLSKKHVDAVAKAVQVAIGLPPENLMICVSHSHSTPWAAGRLDMDSLLAGVEQDAGYIAELRGKLTDLVISASRTTFPCSVGYGTALCGREQGVGGNRRDPVNGPCDPLVYTVVFRDDKDVVRGMFVNYAVHPTVLHADNTRCSADYPGAIRRRLAELYPHATMVFGLGASGDQSTRYFRTGQNYGEVERIGRTLAEAVSLAIAAAKYEEAPRLFARVEAYAPKLRTLPDKAAAEARMEETRARYKALVEADAPYIERQNANVTMLGAEDIYGYIVLQEKGVEIEMLRDELPARLYLFGIGGIRMLALPGEVFMGIADLIREQSACGKLVINTVAGGCLPGYCYTVEAAAEGGYEVDTSMLEDRAGEQMANLAAAMIKEAPSC